MFLKITLRGGNRNRFLGQLFHTERIVIHPEFNLNYDFDVAVIKTVQLLIEMDNFIQPIALGLQGTISEEGSLGAVIGWGITEVKPYGQLKRFFGPFFKGFRLKNNVNLPSLISDFIGLG